jgi:hypothetical protein
MPQAIQENNAISARRSAVYNPPEIQKVVWWESVIIKNNNVRYVILDK